MFQLPLHCLTHVGSLRSLTFGQGCVYTAKYLFPNMLSSLLCGWSWRAISLRAHLSFSQSSLMQLYLVTSSGFLLMKPIGLSGLTISTWFLVVRPYLSEVFSCARPFPFQIRTASWLIVSCCPPTPSPYMVSQFATVCATPKSLSHCFWSMSSVDSKAVDWFFPLALCLLYSTRVLLTPPDRRIVVSGSAYAPRSFSSCPPPKIRPSSIFVILVRLTMLRSFAWRLPSLPACLSNSFFLLVSLFCSSLCVTLSWVLCVINFGLGPSGWLACSCLYSFSEAALLSVRRLLPLEDAVEPVSSMFLL